MRARVQKGVECSGMYDNDTEQGMLSGDSMLSKNKFVWNAEIVLRWIDLPHLLPTTAAPTPTRGRRLGHTPLLCDFVDEVLLSGIVKNKIGRLKGRRRVGCLPLSVLGLAQH